jgi:selenocysteine lyase/cysteine desulfurase
VRRSVLAQLEPPFIDLHAATWTSRNQFELRPDARRFETWESNVAGRIGLGVALEYALTLDVAQTYPRITALSSQLRTYLAAHPSVRVYDLGANPCGIVTFTVAGLDSPAVRDALFRQNINVSVTTPNHTWLDSEARQLPAMVRASVHYYNSEAEIASFVRAIEELAR